MASLRSAWRGSIRLSLITIPIRVFSATTASADVRLHQLHRKCHTRIQMKKFCPHCNRIVENDEIIKGYERGDGRYSLVEQEEISRLRPESSRVVEISDVVKDTAVDPILVERTYFLAPDNKGAGDAFAVLRDALEGRAAVGRVAVHGREYLAAIVKRDQALAMMTLRTKGEVRSASDIEELSFAKGHPKASELKLARQVLDNFETNADLYSFTDHYEERLKEMLESKKAVEVEEAGDAGTPKTARRGGNVVDLMDALRRSVAAAAETGRKAKHKKAKGKVVRHPGARRKAS